MWTRLKAVRSRRGTFLVQEGNRILGCSGDKPLLTSSRSWRPFSFSPPEVWLAVHQGTQGDAHSIVILGSKQGPRQTSRKSSFPFPSPPRRMPSLGVPSSREVDSWRESPGVTSAQGKVASWGTQGWVGGEEEKGGRSFCLLAMREAAGVEKQGRKLSRRELPQGKEVSSEVWLPRALRDPPPIQALASECVIHCLTFRVFVIRAVKSPPFHEWSLKLGSLGILQPSINFPKPPGAYGYYT